VNGKPLDVPRHCDVTAFEGEGFNFGAERPLHPGVSVVPESRNHVHDAPLPPYL
jgi:hypothetical protein